MSSSPKNPDETQETIISNTTTEEEQKPNNNFLEEYELINDSFPDEDPQ